MTNTTRPSKHHSNSRLHTFGLSNEIMPGGARTEIRRTSVERSIDGPVCHHQRLAGPAIALVLATVLSGCGLSSVTSGLGGGLFGGNSKSTAVKSVTEEQMLSAAKADFGGGAVGSNVAHGCPQFVVWSPGHHQTTYLPGRDGDAMAVMHRGEITKTARECQIEPGRVTVKYGFSGRVLLGPAGQTTRVNLPLKVFVQDGNRQRLSSEDMTIAVDVSVENPIAYFSQVRTVTFAIPQGTRPGEFEVLVGFDRPATVGKPASRRKL